MQIFMTKKKSMQIWFCINLILHTKRYFFQLTKIKHVISFNEKAIICFFFIYKTSPGLIKTHIDIFPTQNRY